MPITRENLVIEKKVFAGAPNKKDGITETIRIPLKEERFNITKRPVLLNDVSVYKRKFQGSQRIEETVEKDRVHLETTGDPYITVKESDRH